MMSEDGHPGPQICASALYIAAWAIWAVFCIVNIDNQHAVLTASAPGVAALIVMVVGVIMTPIWVVHVLFTLALRRLFRPRWSMTALAGATGAAGLVALRLTRGMNNEVFDAVALTAAAALCSCIADLAHGAKSIAADYVQEDAQTALMSEEFKENT